MKRIFGFLSIVMLLFVFAACNGDTSDEATGTGSGGNGGDDTINIGATFPLTGPAALTGEQSQRGVDLAVDIVNESGGILGKDLRVIYEDDEGTPEGGTNTLRKLITKDNIKVTLGGLQSSVTLAQREIAKESGILQFVTVSKATEITEEGHDKLFRLNSNSDMDKEFYPEFVSDYGAKDVVIISEQTDYGESEIKALTSAWEESGRTNIVDTVLIQIDETDVSAELTKIKGKDIDGIMLIGSAPTTIATVLTQIKELGIDTDVYLGVGILTPDHVDLAGDAIEDIVNVDTYLWSIENEENELFVSRFEEKYNIKPNKYAVYAYNSLMIIAEAMNKAGTDDPDEVAKVIKENEWKTPSGTITFDEKGQASVDSYTGVTVKDGEIVILE